MALGLLEVRGLPPSGRAARSSASSGAWSTVVVREPHGVADLTCTVHQGSASESKSHLAVFGHTHFALDQLRLPSEPPPLAPATGPPMEQVGFAFESA